MKEFIAKFGDQLPLPLDCVGRKMTAPRLAIGEPNATREPNNCAYTLTKRAERNIVSAESERVNQNAAGCVWIQPCP
jgi:hypothetical protein